MELYLASAHPKRATSPALVSISDIKAYCSEHSAFDVSAAVEKPTRPVRTRTSNPQTTRAPRTRSHARAIPSKTVHARKANVSFRPDGFAVAAKVVDSAAKFAVSAPKTLIATVAAATLVLSMSVSALTSPVEVSAPVMDEAVSVEDGLTVAAPVFDGDVPYVKSADAARLQFAQSGEPWSELPYWGGNVAMNGCGLCSYTTVIDILTGANYTPIDMLYIRGDWEGMDNYADDSTGLDGMTHGEFTLATFGIEQGRIDVDLDTLAATTARGDSVAVVCAGGDDFLGTMGDEHTYPGHFVVVWDFDGENFHVHDSATSHGYGCDVIYTPSEMQALLDGTSSIMAYRKLV